MPCKPWLLTKGAAEGVTVVGRSTSQAAEAEMLESWKTDYPNQTIYGVHALQ